MIEAKNSIAFNVTPTSNDEGESQLNKITIRSDWQRQQQKYRPTLHASKKVTG